MKFKSVLFSIFLLFESMAIMAEVVDTARAHVVVRQFLEARTKVSSVEEQAVVLAYTAVNEQRQAVFYVFNVGQSAFVMISAEDAFLPILAYSFSNRFQTNNIPPAVREWMHTYEEQVNAIRLQKESVSDPMWKMLEEGMYTTHTTQSVQPFILTHWGQSGSQSESQNHYNLFCPYDTVYKKYTLTGCVATAMAQVMKYWAYPQTGAGEHHYTHTNYGVQYANFENASYVYDSMTNTYDSNSRVGQINAVSLLMYHCGVSVDMNYGVDGSSAVVNGLYKQTAESALKRYFGYPDAKAVQRIEYTDADWLQIIKKELDNKRPVIYAGASRISGGHAFVCDGYDVDNYLHFNWGWNGSMDGYFSISALKPGNMNFTDNQVAIIGIQPPKTMLKPDENNILYVAEKGVGREDGSSWENATSSLEAALCRATIKPLQIWVKAGHYYGKTSDTNAFVVHSNVSVYGGFVGGEGGNYDLSLRNWKQNATILDGQRMQRVLFLSAESDGQKARCDGFIIKNGVVRTAFTYGGGVYLQQGAVLSNCLVDSCSAEHLYAHGGGVAMKNAIVEACQICHCSALQAHSGGGLSMVSGSKNNRVINTLIDHNQATFGGGAAMWGGGEFINCNFIANLATKNGSALYASAYQDTSRLVNCIVWKNRLQQYSYYQLTFSQTEADVRYCAVEKNGYKAGLHLIVLDSNNEGSSEGVAYPFFVHPAAGDYHLQPTSSCIDAGTNEVQLPVTDWDGNCRVFKASTGGVVDIGMYEFSKEYAKEYNYYDTLCQGRSYQNYDFCIETYGAGDTLCFRENADTLYKLHLHVLPRCVVEMTAFISEHNPTYAWEDSVYSQKGDYQRVYVDANGCDSIRILHLLDNEHVNEFSLDKGVKIYPNPTVSEVYISVKESILSLLDYFVICDLQGRILYKSGQLRTENRVELSNWVAGMYFVTFCSEGRVLHAQKLMKQ